MKNRADKLLLAVFAVTLSLHFFIVFTYLEIIPLERPYWLYNLHAWLTITFAAVPVFCLQLFLCRRKRRWVAATPAILILGAGVWFVYGFFTADGWDTLGWGLLMVLSIAPAAGCALAWVAYALWRVYQRGDIHEN